MKRNVLLQVDIVSILLLVWLPWHSTNVLSWDKKLTFVQKIAKTTTRCFSVPRHNTAMMNSPLMPNEKLKKMVDLLVNPNSESQRDELHRMQNMLEETLTKNMHLQKDLEFLSQELARLNQKWFVHNFSYVLFCS